MSIDDLNTIPVVIMAGGKGERLKPYTDIIPKMLIPIGDIPIIERIISNFVTFNFNNFFISINYKKDIIKAYFNTDYSYKITLIEEDSPLGTAGSLFLLRDKINSTFFVSNCDIIIDANYSEILKFHKNQKNKITVIAALKNYRIPYGIFNVDKDGNICSLEEKPNYEFWVNTGMYVIEPDIFDFLVEEKYYDMTDVLEEYIEIGNKVGIYPVTSDSWLDMGEFDSLKSMISKLKL